MCLGAPAQAVPTQAIQMSAQLSEELDRLKSRDDAITAALISYGLVACLLMLAYCVNQSLLSGEASGRLCTGKQDALNIQQMQSQRHSKRLFTRDFSRITIEKLSIHLPVLVIGCRKEKKTIFGVDKEPANL